MLKYIIKHSINFINICVYIREKYLIFLLNCHKPKCINNQYTRFVGNLPPKFPCIKELKNKLNDLKKSVEHFDL